MLGGGWWRHEKQGGPGGGVGVEGDEEESRGIEEGCGDPTQPLI